MPYARAVVCVSASYKANNFQHWGDGSTNPCKTVTPTSNILMTAVYAKGTSGSSGTSQLTITSQGATGSAITGFWTVLYTSSGTVAATGYTPITYTLTNGQSYTVNQVNSIAD